MKHFLLVVAFSLQIPVIADAAAWPAANTDRSRLEALYRCQWLTAGSDAAQQQEQPLKHREMQVRTMKRIVIDLAEQGAALRFDPAVRG
jgi:hypothetical protein